MFRYYGAIKRDSTGRKTNNIQGGISRSVEGVYWLVGLALALAVGRQFSCWRQLRWIARSNNLAWFSIGLASGITRICSNTPKRQTERGDNI